VRSLLPAAGWRRVMSGLTTHFGEDASLDAAKVAGIERYLVAHAGNGDGALQCITEQRWSCGSTAESPRRVGHSPTSRPSPTPAPALGAERGLEPPFEAAPDA